MSCFTRTIQGPGRGTKRSQAGWAVRKRYGALIPSRDCHEHQENDWARLRESETERRAEIRRGAGRGQHGGEDALEKRTGVTFACAPSENPGRGRGRQSDFENAKKIEREDEDDRAHPDDEIGIGELECPRDFAPGRFQANDQKSEPMNQAKMPAANARPLPKMRRPAVTGVLNETENFE